MSNKTYRTDTRSPDFVDLMNLYGKNYRLLITILEHIGDSENSIRNKRGYILEIRRKHNTRYTQNIELYYSFHTRKRGRKIVIAIVNFKVRIYLDTRQAAVIFNEVELKKPFPIHGLFLSLRAKWYYNNCLKAVLSSFFSD